MDLQSKDNLKQLEKQWVDICAKGAQSLAPDRSHPTNPATIIRNSKELTENARQALATKMIELVETMDTHFPDNIYWDIDALVQSFIFHSLEETENSTHQRFEIVMELMRVFGCRGVIRFQFFHDFTLGFDWIKWYQKTSPADPDITDPFAKDFLNYMLRRGREIVSAIKNDDQKYPALDGDDYRNSYIFDRTPQFEKKGLKVLRDHNAIPLKVWDVHANISLTIDYLKRRESILTSGEVG